MGVREHLQHGEVMVSEHPPFYLTSQRLLWHQEGPDGEQSRALPLERLISVEEIRTTHHPLMVVGSLLIISGVFLTLVWGLITPVLAIIAGVVALVMGSRGRTTGYQFRAHNLPMDEEALWRLEYWGSGHFITTVRNRITDPSESRP